LDIFLLYIYNVFLQETKNFFKRILVYTIVVQVKHFLILLNMKTIFLSTLDFELVKIQYPIIGVISFLQGEPSMGWADLMVLKWPLQLITYNQN